MITQKTIYLNLLGLLLLGGCGNSDNNPFSPDATAMTDARPTAQDSALTSANANTQDGRIQDGSTLRDASSATDATVDSDASSATDATVDRDAWSATDATVDGDAWSSATDAAVGTDAAAVDSGAISGRSCDDSTARKCRRDEYCKYSLAAQCGEAGASGECTARPDACRDVVDPVCGCDGKNYSNACYAAVAGVSVASEGDCPQ